MTIFDVDQLVKRINTAVPGAEAGLLPDAGHALTMTPFDECLAIVRSTLAATADS